MLIFPPIAVLLLPTETVTNIKNENENGSTVIGLWAAGCCWEIINISWTCSKKKTNLKIRTNKKKEWQSNCSAENENATGQAKMKIDANSRAGLLLIKKSWMHGVLKHLCCNYANGHLLTNFRQVNCISMEKHGNSCTGSHVKSALTSPSRFSRPSLSILH